MASDQDKAPDRPTLLPRGVISLWLLLTILWVIINATSELPNVLSGAIIALALAWIFCRRSNVWHGIAMTPRGIYHFLAYAAVFFTELVKANINMLRYVYSPRIAIHPGIVKIDLRLKSPLGRLALSNSIALTPGSLVIDITDDALFVHWLDVKTRDQAVATEMIAGPFEKYLGVAFG